LQENATGAGGGRQWRISVSQNGMDSQASNGDAVAGFASMQKGARKDAIPTATFQLERRSQPDNL
jgi:hypothetical protein